MFGRTLPDIASILFSDETPDRQLELIDMCCEHEHELLRKYGAPLYPAWSQVFEILSGRYPLFLVSNCEAGYIETFLECTGFGCYIKDHLCPGDTGNAKADNILEIIRRHDLKVPAYVGDTAGDYRAVKEAGPQIPFVFASYGFGEVENPDYIIHSPLDLTNLFDSTGGGKAMSRYHLDIKEKIPSPGFFLCFAYPLAHLYDGLITFFGIMYQAIINAYRSILEQKNHRRAPKLKPSFSLVFASRGTPPW